MTEKDYRLLENKIYHLEMPKWNGRGYRSNHNLRKEGFRLAKIQIINELLPQFLQDTNITK